MKVVITGGAGFVGSNIALYLKAKYPGYTITAFDNLKRRGSEINLADFKAKGIEFVHGDIRNPEDVDQLGEYDAMIEASAEPSVSAGLDGSPSYVINNNLTGAINCFNHCVKNKANMIFLSTSRVYPISYIEHAAFIEEKTRFSFSDKQAVEGISSKGIAETLPLDDARSFYGTTKLAAEYLVKEYQQFYGMKAAVTRFGVIAGPRQMGKTDQGVATLWMARHFWDKELAYIGYGGQGKQVRDILHVDDVVSLIDTQLHDIDTFNSGVFNAGGGLKNSASLMEMTELCKEITGNIINIKSIPETRAADLRIYISDNSKIVKQTGWQPEKSLHDIFNEIFEWIRSNEKELKPLLG